MQARQAALRRAAALRAQNRWYTAGVLAGLFVFAVAALGMGFGIAAFVRDNEHHRETHDHIKAVGFSVAKNASQDLVDNTTTVVDTWAADDGYPLYDNSRGFFNLTSGVFTAGTSARWIATGTVCFSPSANGTREVRLVTDGAASGIVFAREVGADTLSGDQCIGVHQVQNLQRGAMVWLEAFSDSGNTELITEESRFSVERVAINS